ncbi:hypothetical protein Srubr_24030 [Streptomyces rubradiris]|uniref:Uncharacterized protein n=2 Tax=Streptomyces rubradiris TaxID=285531 RepID=A0ABQ3R9Q6_STRRR|nr:hypothetical protein GCM10018792_14580 [Streptomyces rubradiris]GHI52557.1 hypothetical protein Srubr_24030 [Streptomyces rubradiris]
MRRAWPRAIWRPTPIAKPSMPAMVPYTSVMSSIQASASSPPENSTRATPPERISHVTVAVALSIADTDPPSYLRGSWIVMQEGLIAIRHSNSALHMAFVENALPGQVD